MCLKNLTIQLKDSPATYTRLDGEFYLSNDTQSGRPKWINKRDSNKEWFYRINKAGVMILFDSTHRLFARQPAMVRNLFACVRVWPARSAATS